MENKNTIIALVLMLAVWLGFTFLFPAPPPETPPSSGGSSAAGPGPSPVTPPPLSVTSSLPEVLAAPVKEQEWVVENDVFRAVLSNSGGRLKSLELKKYRSSASKDSPPIALVEHAPGRPATLRTTGQAGWSLAPDALYNTSAAEGMIRLAPGDERQIVFTHQLASGLLIEKIYTFRGDSHYDIDLQLRVTNGGSVPQTGSLSLALVRPWDESQKGGQFEHIGPSSLVGTELEHTDIEDLGEKAQEFGPDTVWTGFSDKYFLAAAVPLSGAAEKVRLEKTPLTVENLLLTPSRSLAPGERVSFDYLLYFGPKDLDLLKAVDHQLAEAVDFGFFALIAKPLLHVLKFFYSFLGNYGLAIILLTVIIKLLFWPLTQKSYASMKAMQKLQPEMQKIREKFGKDRERLNRELMELYKKNRVNPLGGCLPMLVQIPVFFALYKVLMETIDLRHAPFYFWITDLSAKDPYYITPLIMGASMFVQQKMTPTTMDPVQAKIFMLMPVIFTFMFLNFPSGLVIYWLVNNLLTIGQQTLINRKA